MAAIIPYLIKCHIFHFANNSIGNETVNNDEIIILFSILHHAHSLCCFLVPVSVFFETSIIQAWSWGWIIHMLMSDINALSTCTGRACTPLFKCIGKGGYLGTTKSATLPPSFLPTLFFSPRCILPPCQPSHFHSLHTHSIPLSFFLVT